MAEQLLQTVTDFVVKQMAALPEAARLAIVLDPYRHLALGSTIEVEGRTWQVSRYAGNDLAFRHSYTAGDHDLIWVTCPSGWSPQTLPRIELCSLMDIWRRADTFIDASLPGVLRQLVPHEAWPDESVWACAQILGQNLPAVTSGARTLRRYLPRGAVLDIHSVRALALHSLQPEMPVQDFLFQHDSPARVLDAYVGLLWEAPWETTGMALLQNQARQAPRLELGTAEAWLEVPGDSLALYLYLRRALARYRVPGIANQLRGLGLLDFDPEVLEPWVDTVLKHWDTHRTWREQVIARAEERLQREDVTRIVRLLALESPEAAFQELIHGETPALVYALGAHFLQLALGTRSLYHFTPTWLERRPQVLSDPPQTAFTDAATRIGWLLDELALIDSRRRQAIPAQADLAQLLDWYVESGLYDLEYAHARAARQATYLPNDELRRTIQAYLDVLQGDIRDYLDKADRALADVISNDWDGYLSHPRLSTYVLWDTVKKRRLSPTTEAALWIVIFDGMRWDTWASHVKPRLLERFELVAPEKAYLCLLPSWTGVARTGLLAGKQPDGWRSYDGRYTSDQGQLVAQLLGLPQRSRKRLLQFYSGMESDRQYRQLDTSQRVPYNVLIYNISDDNLHSQRGNLIALNETVDRLLDDIFQALDNLIQPGDMLVVSSDHGFVELVDGYEAVIPDDTRWQRYREGAAHPVRWRYALTHDLPKDVDGAFAVEYPRIKDRYTVAVGKRWFKRADWRGQSDRYAHGGLSFAEMVVPGVVLRPIVERRIELVIEAVPSSLKLVEGEVASLGIQVSNKGNVQVAGRLRAQSNTAVEAVLYHLDLGPGERREYSCAVEAVYHKHSDGTTEATERVVVLLSYTDLDGKATERRKVVPVEVTPRADVVEIDFGGLQDL